MRRLASVVVATMLGCLAVLAIGPTSGCGGSGEEVTGTPETLADVATVTLGGYNFGAKSNVLTHPCFTAGIGSPQWVAKGYGSEAGRTVRASFGDGGLVKNVKTLKMTVTLPGSEPMYFWLGQDTAGNIHYLKAKDSPRPARLTGVAAGQKPWFWLPRPSVTVKGRTWYEYRNGVRVRENKILSVAASCHGKSALVQLRDIHDEGSPPDGVFDPSWTGPDNRHDLYFDPVTHRPWALVMGPTGGYAG